MPVRSYGKGTGIVIPITRTQLWEWEGNLRIKKKFWQIFLRIAGELENHRPSLFKSTLFCSGV